VQTGELQVLLEANCKVDSHYCHSQAIASLVHTFCIEIQYVVVMRQLQGDVEAMHQNNINIIEKAARSFNDAQ
jgi:division protein CdvB (Snf7/Vps24/ESCRT-III family)